MNFTSTRSATVEPKVKPTVETDVLTQIDPQTLEDSHVYVH